MIRKLFLTLSFLLVSLLAIAQQEQARQQEEFLYWESVLDAYNDFADTRAQLRGNRRAAEILREKQLRIEELLRHPKGKMTEQQQQRFNAISLRAGLPLAVPVSRGDDTAREENNRQPPPAPPAVSKATKTQSKTLAASPAKEESMQETEEVIPLRERPGIGIGPLQTGIRPLLTPRPANYVVVPQMPSPETSIKLPWHYYVLLQSGFSFKWKSGLMAGAVHPSGIGLYAGVQFRPSFIRPGDTYLTEHPEIIWTNGKSAMKELTAHAGLLGGKGPILFYLGAGYGRRTVYWQDSDNAWAQITTASFSGISVETGGIVPLGRRICLGLGLETLAFKTLGVTGSIGIHF